MIEITDGASLLQAVKSVRNYCGTHFGVLPGLKQTKDLIDNIRDLQSSTRDKDAALMAAAQLIADRFSAGHPDTAQQVLEIAKEITAKEAA